MKKVIFVLSSAIFLLGCASDDTSKQKEVQTPQFGKPESAIPWNEPADWEKNGQLGSMPGFNQSH